MTVLKNLSIQPKIREGKLKYLYYLAVVEKLPPCRYISLCVYWFPNWELFSYYRSCSTNQN